MSHINTKRTPLILQQQQQQQQQTGKLHIFLEDIKFIFLTVKTAGLLPFYDNINEYQIAAPTRNNRYYTYFIRCLINALVVHNLYLFASLELFDPYENILYTTTDLVTKIFEAIYVTFLYVAMTINNSWNSEKFITIINELLAIDQEIYKRQNIKNSGFLKNKCEFSKKFIIGIVLSQIYFTYLETIYESNNISIVYYIAIVIYNTQNALVTMSIVFLATLLRIVSMRFAYLNAILRKYNNAATISTTGCYNQTNWRHHMLHRQQQKEKQKNIDIDLIVWEMFSIEAHYCYDLHSKLLHTYKLINDCCGLIVALYLGYAFFTITATTYYIFVQVSSELKIQLPLLQYCVAWLIYNFSILTILVRNCHQASKEANNTSVILTRVYRKSKEHRNVIDKYLTKCVRHEVQFTAYGFFTIDNSTLFKIFSAVTTYLVILIQFKQLEDATKQELLKIKS